MVEIPQTYEGKGEEKGKFKPAVQTWGLKDAQFLNKHLLQQFIWLAISHRLKRENVTGTDSFQKAVCSDPQQLSPSYVKRLLKASYPLSRSQLSFSFFHLPIFLTDRINQCLSTVLQHTGHRRFLNVSPTHTKRLTWKSQQFTSSNPTLTCV